MAAALAAVAVAAVSVHVTGPLSAAIVAGASMAPGIERGDVVVVRQASRYKAGDVVAYRHPDLGLLLHRIIGWEEASGSVSRAGPADPLGGGRLVLQGDNNPRPDSYHPLPSELKGRLLLRIPAAGRAIDWLRRPAMLAAVAALAAAVAAAPLLREPGRRRRARRRLALGAVSASGVSLAGMLGLAAVFFGALLAGVQLVGTSRSVPVEQSYRQVGTFGYSARAGGGVFDAEFARDGDPVFRALSETVRVTFDYRFQSELPAEISGTYRLYARLSHPSGWTRTLPILEPAQFSGTALTVEGTLDLAAAQALIDRLEEAADVRGGTYELTLTAEVDADGTVGEFEIADHFPAALRFRLDKNRLQMVSADDPLVITQQGVIRSLRTQERTVPMPGFSLRLSDLRLLAAAGLALSLGGSGAIAAFAAATRNEDEVAVIRARHAHLLVSARLDQLPGRTAIAEVGRFQDLADIARREGLTIIDEDLDVGPYFVLVSGDTTYFYRAVQCETREGGEERAPPMAA